MTTTGQALENLLAYVEAEGYTCDCGADEPCAVCVAKAVVRGQRRPTSVSAPCHCGGVMFGDGRAHAPHCPSFGERNA